MLQMLQSSTYLDCVHTIFPKQVLQVCGLFAYITLLHTTLSLHFVCFTERDCLISGEVPYVHTRKRQSVVPKLVCGGVAGLRSFEKRRVFVFYLLPQEDILTRIITRKRSKTTTSLLLHTRKQPAVIRIRAV
jgi:hypothetical protein